MPIEKKYTIENLASSFTENLGMDQDVTEHFFESVQTGEDLGKLLSLLKPEEYPYLLSVKDEISIILATESLNYMLIPIAEDPQRVGAIYELIKKHWIDKVHIQNWEDFFWCLTYLPQEKRGEFAVGMEKKLPDLLRTPMQLLEVVIHLNEDQKEIFLATIKHLALQGKIKDTVFEYSETDSYLFRIKWANKYKEAYDFVYDRLINDPEIHDFLSHRHQPIQSISEEPSPFINIDMHILAGFITALGVASVAIGLAILCTTTFGVAGAAIATAGVATLGTTGIFSKMGFFSNKEQSIDNTEELENKSKPLG
ncbi:hypothetical protein ACD661_05120 [Legionella lytica]|uniref:Uncharacterized protein n=1 Tax=Legionella lytica TaxID=96232 RepID=A0ABW8D8Y0_9GAMM